MDHLTALRAFCAVVETGTFSAAARRLRLSNAAISKNVSELEAHLGAPLLIRSTRKSSLTEVGADFYDRISSLLSDLEEAEADASRNASEPTGPLRIAAPMSLGLLMIAPRIAPFMARYPGIVPTLDFSDGPSDMIGDRFDVIIRVRSALPDSSLIARKLTSLDHVICGAPGYFDNAGVPRSPDDLPHHRILVYTHAMTPERWSLSRNGRTEKVDLTPALRANNSLVIRDALIGGAGLALIPRLYVEEALANGQLVTVLDDWNVPQLWIYALYASNRNLPARTRAFLDYLVETTASTNGRD